MYMETARKVEQLEQEQCFEIIVYVLMWIQKLDQLKDSSSLVDRHILGCGGGVSF